MFYRSEWKQTEKNDEGLRTGHVNITGLPQVCFESFGCQLEK